MNYFATGEGMTHEINTCWADNEKEALEEHLDSFGYKDASSRNYFGAGIVVMDASSKDAKDLMCDFLKDGDKLFHLMQEAVFELHLKLYWNLS